MATYSISAPDGNTYSIEGPEGASQKAVENEVLRQNPSAGTAALTKGLHAWVFHKQKEALSGPYKQAQEPWAVLVCLPLLQGSLVLWRLP